MFSLNCDIGDQAEFTINGELVKRIIAGKNLNLNKKTGIPSSIRLYFTEGDGIVIKLSSVTFYERANGSLIPTTGSNLLKDFGLKIKKLSSTQ